MFLLVICSAISRLVVSPVQTGVLPGVVEQVAAVSSRISTPKGSAPPKKQKKEVVWQKKEVKSCRIVK